MPGEINTIQERLGRFPTSRFLPVPLVRPLEVFGKSFDVELSSGLTFGPDTVLRASIGKSLQTLLREQGKLLPLKQLRDGLLGLHRLSSTTKASIRASMGPLGDQFGAVLNGGPIPSDLGAMSDWVCLAASWGPLSSDNLLDVVVASFIDLDQLVESAALCASAHGQAAGEKLLQARFGRTLSAWRELCPDLSLEGCLRIETSLLVVVDLLGSAGAIHEQETTWAAPALELLNPDTKPLGNWLRQVATAVKCANYRELADVLARKGILHHGDRPITHDTLKGWSAMKPGMLMSIEGCQSLVQVVANTKAAGRLRSRFALARFLAFLCDFLRSSVRAQAPSWPETQALLQVRLKQLCDAKAST